MKIRYSLLLMVAFLTVSVTGCSTMVNQISVPEELSRAEDQLEDGDLDGANDTYEGVLQNDPNNAEANFYTALIGMFDVVTDPSTRDLAAKFGVTNLPTSVDQLLTLPATSAASSRIMAVTSFNQAALASPVAPSEVQAYIAQTLLPALDKALARLALVEQNANFTYLVPKSVSGADVVREIDLGEVYALDVYISLIKATLHEAIAYNWDYDYASKTNPFTDASLPNFGALKADGADNMRSAQAAYIRLVDKASAAISYIDAEKDDQSNDIIPKFRLVSDRDNSLQTLAEIKSSLLGTNTSFQVSTWKYVSGQGWRRTTKTVVYNLRNFYETPVENWRAFYVTDTDGNGTITSADFPASYDFTLSGLFPELNSYTAWANIFN